MVKSSGGVSRQQLATRPSMASNRSSGSRMAERQYCIFRLEGTKPIDFKIPETKDTKEEVARHNRKDHLWIVVKGPQALFSHRGKDASEG